MSSRSELLKQKQSLFPFQSILSRKRWSGLVACDLPIFKLHMVLETICILVFAETLAPEQTDGTYPALRLQPIVTRGM